MNLIETINEAINEAIRPMGFEAHAPSRGNCFTVSPLDGLDAIFAPFCQSIYDLHSTKSTLMIRREFVAGFNYNLQSYNPDAYTSLEIYFNGLKKPVLVIRSDDSYTLNRTHCEGFFDGKSSAKTDIILEKMRQLTKLFESLAE